MMPYLRDYKRSGVRQIQRGPGPRRTSVRALSGFGCGMGAFSDTDQCSTIPLGDPYRKPGNYCATPDGGLTTFNADGSTFRQPGGGVDPDPAHPPGATATSGSGGSVWDIFGRMLGAATVPGAAPTVAPVPAGISPTTMILIASGALALVVLIARK